MAVFRTIRDSRSIRWIDPQWINRYNAPKEIVSNATIPMIYDSDDIVGVYQDPIDIMTPEFYFFISVDEEIPPEVPIGYNPLLFLTPVTGDEREAVYSVRRGNRFSFYVFLFRRSSGTPVPLTDAVIIFTMKWDFNDADVDAIAQYKSTDVPSYITITSSAEGKIQVDLQPEATASLPNRDKKYPFSIKVIQSGSPYTPVSGYINVLPEATISNS